MGHPVASAKADKNERLISLPSGSVTETARFRSTSWLPEADGQAVPGRIDIIRAQAQRNAACDIQGSSSSGTDRESAASRRPR